MHICGIYGNTPFVKKSYKIVRLSLLIVSPFVLLGAVVTRFDPFLNSDFRRFSVRKGSVVETIPCDGQIWYHHVAYIKPPNSGRTEKVLVRAGQKVAAGDELLSFTTSEGAELLDVAKSRKSPHFNEMREVFKAVPLLTYFSGLIFEVNASTGSTFTSDDNLFLIADELMANVQVAETSMPKIRIGQKATVTINSLPGEPIRAVIKEIPLEGFEPSDGVVLYTLVLKPESLPPEARIGMSTEASLEVDRRDDVMFVPHAAILHDGSQTSVRVTSFGWTTQQRPVELGLDNGSTVEIKSGLKLGDVVLVPRAEEGAGDDLSKDLEETIGSDPRLADHTETPSKTEAKTEAKTDSKSSKADSNSKAHDSKNANGANPTQTKQSSSSKHGFGSHSGGNRHG